ncbi:hypothetical protein ACLQ28_03265 [Micromonospora sp. DT201]|uniref:hypothetical protein n=1 Tax=Micromonospora sp. DT201 TaxID=3393442 RepID=UPI003CF76D72
MEQFRRRTQAFYLPAEVRDHEITPEQETPTPRPGHGTIYIYKSRDMQRQIVWSAKWVDELPDGQMAGVESIEGSRDDVLRWARSRPAAERVIPSEQEPYWTPAPDNDDDIDL